MLLTCYHYCPYYYYYYYYYFYHYDYPAYWCFYKYDTYYSLEASVSHRA